MGLPWKRIWVHAIFWTTITMMPIGIVMAFFKENLAAILLAYLLSCFIGVAGPRKYPIIYKGKSKEDR